MLCLFVICMFVSARFLLIKDEQSSANKPIIIESEDLQPDCCVEASAEVLDHLVTNDQGKCHHEQSALRSLMSPDLSEARRCVKCFRARLRKFRAQGRHFDDCTELVNDLKAFEHALASCQDFCQSLEMLTPSEACVFLEILVSDDDDNSDSVNVKTHISSPLVNLSTQLLKQLVAIGAPCITSDFVRITLQVTLLIKPKHRAEVLSAISDWMRTTPANSPRLETEIVPLLDASFALLSHRWTPATTNTFKVLTDLVATRFHFASQTTARRYADLCLEVLNRSQLNQGNFFDMSSVKGVAIRGLSTLASNCPESLFEPVNSALVNLFKNLHTFSQPLVVHLCGLLTSAIKGYGSAKQIVSRACFDGLLGDSIMNCPSLDALVSVLDCLVSAIEFYQRRLYYWHSFRFP